MEKYQLLPLVNHQTSPQTLPQVLVFLRQICDLEFHEENRKKWGFRERRSDYRETCFTLIWYGCFECQIQISFGEFSNKPLVDSLNSFSVAEICIECVRHENGDGDGGALNMEEVVVVVVNPILEIKD